MTETVVPRRERLRRMTLDEIHRHALDQVDEGGIEAVSLSAIARQLGMAQASIYRYYASREELLRELRRRGYEDITAAVEEAERGAATRPAGERLGILVSAYRDWAVRHPLRYGLIFGARPGTSDTSPAIAAIHGSMRAILRVLATLGVPPRPAELPTTELEQEFADLAVRRDEPPEVSPHLLRLGTAVFVRTHGVVSLELAGVLADMGVHPEHLLQQEVADLVVTALA